nr:hypothetical protein [uncultured Desulfobacter sp.]
MKRLFYILAVLFTISIFFQACEKKGPAEKAGEKIDHVIESAGDAIKDAGESIKDTAQ